MNSDIRLSVSFKGHRKRIKLRHILGDRSDSYLIDLWITVSMDRPNGRLEGWDAFDIAISSGWDGKPDDFVKALIETGWLELIDGVYIINNWEEKQSWECNSKKRS